MASIASFTPKHLRRGALLSWLVIVLVFVALLTVLRPKEEGGERPFASSTFYHAQRGHTAAQAVRIASTLSVVGESPTKETPPSTDHTLSSLAPGPALHPTNKGKVVPPSSQQRTAVPLSEWADGSASTAIRLQRPERPIDCSNYPIDWAADDLHPLARDYLEKHVVLVVVTSRTTQDSRLRAAWCTWLSHLPESSLLVVSDDVGANKGLFPGTWWPGGLLPTLTPVQIVQREGLHTAAPSWVAGQVRYLDAISIGMRTAQSGLREVRWVGVVSDETFINLNELVATLHSNDLKALYNRLPVQQHECEDMAGGLHLPSQWGKQCERLLGSANEAKSQCIAVRQRMCQLLEQASFAFPTLTTPYAMLSRVSTGALRSKMLGDGVVRRRSLERLWRESVDLTGPRWISWKLLPPVHMTRRGVRGVGHFLSVSSQPLVAQCYPQGKCKQLVSVQGMDVDTALLSFFSLYNNVTRTQKTLCTTTMGAPDYAQCLGNTNRKRMMAGTMAVADVNYAFMLREESKRQVLSWFYQALYQHNATARRELRMEYRTEAVRL